MLNPIVRFFVRLCDRNSFLRMVMRCNQEALRLSRYLTENLTKGPSVAFITYTARLKGVPIHLVEPSNTSPMCPACGHCSAHNRKTQALFTCTSCGFAGPADVIAAQHIRRVVVSQPHFPDTLQRAE